MTEVKDEESFDDQPDEETPLQRMLKEYAQDFDAFKPNIINYDPFCESVETKALHLFEVTFQHLKQAINQPIDEDLLQRIAERVLLIGQQQIMANIEGWFEESDKDDLKSPGEVWQRMYIGAYVLFDSQKLGTGPINDWEKVLIKHLNQHEWSVRKLARVFKRSESTIQKYKR